MEDELVQESISSRARSDAWIVKVLDCYLEWDTCRGHRVKRYADTFERNMKLTVDQIVELTRAVVEWGELEELDVLIDKEKTKSLEKKGWWK